jgi:uncharacterized protein DUF4920
MSNSQRFALCCLTIALLAGCQDSNNSPAKSTSATANPPAPSASAKSASFGAPMKLSTSETVPVQQLLANPTEYDGKYVRVAGTVEKVCPRKGCWLTLHDEKSNEALFVKFPDPPEGRLIPMDAVGKPVVVEGTVKVKEISEAMARHYKQDAGAPESEITKIVGPQKQISITNGSAMVAGVEQPVIK